MSKLRERISSLFWGTVFGLAAIACIVGIAMSDHVGWGFEGWGGRLFGTLLLAGAAFGGFLPDLRSRGDQATTADAPDLDGFSSTYESTPSLAAAIGPLARLDPGPAHVLFRTSREGAWGVRPLLVRFAVDHYVMRWDAIARSQMMEDLVVRMNQDPYWSLVRGVFMAGEHARGKALHCFAAAAARDPADPTPMVRRGHACGTAG